jgi:hypothetical protein
MEVATLEVPVAAVVQAQRAQSTRAAVEVHTMALVLLATAVPVS